MSEPEQDVQVEIQKTLVSINEVTIKIKKELMMIIDLIKEEGRLDIAVKDANEVLSNAVQELGINMTDNPTDAEENKEQSGNEPMRVSSDLITKNMLSFIEDTKMYLQ